MEEEIVEKEISNSRSVVTLVQSILVAVFSYLNIYSWSMFGKFLFWIISGVIASYFLYVVFFWLREVINWGRREFYPRFDAALYFISFATFFIAIYLFNYSIKGMI